jgi:hypothetical protein
LAVWSFGTLRPVLLKVVDSIASFACESDFSPRYKCFQLLGQQPHSFCAESSHPITQALAHQNPGTLVSYLYTHPSETLTFLRIWIKECYYCSAKAFPHRSLAKRSIFLTKLSQWLHLEYRQVYFAQLLKYSWLLQQLLQSLSSKVCRLRVIKRSRERFQHFQPVWTLFWAHHSINSPNDLCWRVMI